jgi:cyclopropane fatty-acyl-phospholipid synthase-like methyltransferase
MDSYTHSKRIHRALELSQLSPGEILYDLGSGDGRVLILANSKIIYFNR